jgi:hypothetical protein
LIPEKRQLNVRVSVELIHVPGDYCGFIDSGNGYVVEESLQYTFKKDESFRE